MDRTSTSPGFIYATPRLLAMSTSPPYNLKGCRASFRYRVVLIARAAADADSAYDFAVLPQWNPAGENHDLAIVRGVDSEELPARLRMSSQILGRNIESP